MHPLRFCFLIFLIFSCAAGNAQMRRLDKPEWYVGTTQGITLSSVGFFPNITQDYLIFGYNGGVMVRYIDERNTGFQLELNYSQRGWSESSRLYKRQLDYIEMPFLTHIYLGNRTRFFINLGPKIGLYIGERELLNKVGNSTEEQHIRKIQHAFDYGIALGMGFQFFIKKNAFQFETRFYYGLSDVYANTKRDVFDRSNNMNLSANLGWLLHVN